MPQRATEQTPKKSPAKQKPKKAGPSLADSLALLQSELASLRQEVTELRTATPVALERERTLSPDHSDAADAIMAGMVSQMGNGVDLDSMSLAAELEFALLNPEPGPEDSPEQEIQVEEVSDEENSQFLTDNPDIADVMHEIEMALPADSDDFAEDDSPLMSAAEIDALIAATSQLGASVEETPEQADSNSTMSESDIQAMLAANSASPAPEPEVTEKPGGTMSDAEIQAMLAASADTQASEPIAATEESGGLLMSNDEIQALLSATTPAARAPEPEEATVAPIVSAAEIQAMLGIKDPSQEIEPNHVAVATEPEISVVTNEDPVQLIAEESEPDLTVVSCPVDIDLESIDQFAIEKVPGVLAAAGLAVPVCIVDAQLHCMAVEPFDEDALAEITKACGMPVVPHAAPIDKVLANLRARYGAEDDPHVWDSRIVTKPSLISKILRRPA